MNTQNVSNSLKRASTTAINTNVIKRKASSRHITSTINTNREPHSYPRTIHDEKQAEIDRQFRKLQLYKHREDREDREDRNEEDDWITLPQPITTPTPTLFSSSSSSLSDSTCMKCEHCETEIVNGVNVCLDCGQHLDEVIDSAQEWRYYYDQDNKNSNDPSRCQFRKTHDKGIRKDLEKLNLPTKIVNLADQYYAEVTSYEDKEKGEMKSLIKRGALRKGIMYACVFQAYKKINKHQLPEPLRNLFQIDKKNASHGTTFFKKRKKIVEDDDYTTAEHFIPKVCEKFGFMDPAIEEVKELYRQLRVKYPQIDHSYPQSVACGCVFYVLKNKNIDITGEQFGKIVGLSSITIMKKCNEIEEIMCGVGIE
jgi:transcription initiation factor TFIIIB Brf1 subunit/transcription initiation factor TFIIB